MSISIDEDPHPFSQLLFVRAEWQLAAPEVPAIETSDLIPFVTPPGPKSITELPAGPPAAGGK